MWREPALHHRASGRLRGRCRLIRCLAHGGGVLRGHLRCRLTRRCHRCLIRRLWWRHNWRFGEGRASRGPWGGALDHISIDGENRVDGARDDARGGDRLLQRGSLGFGDREQLCAHRRRVDGGHRIFDELICRLKRDGQLEELQCQRALLGGASSQSRMLRLGGDSHGFSLCGKPFLDRINLCKGHHHRMSTFAELRIVGDQLLKLAGFGHHAAHDSRLGGHAFRLTDGNEGFGLCGWARNRGEGRACAREPVGELGRDASNPLARVQPREDPIELGLGSILGMLQLGPSRLHLSFDAAHRPRQQHEVRSRGAWDGVLSQSFPLAELKGRLVALALQARLQPPRLAHQLGHLGALALLSRPKVTTEPLELRQGIGRRGNLAGAQHGRSTVGPLEHAVQLRVELTHHLFCGISLLGAMLAQSLPQLRDVGDDGPLVESQVGDARRHGSRGEVGEIHIPRITVDLLARRHEVLDIEQPRHTKPGLGHGEGELEVLTEIDGSIRRWYDVVHHVGRVVVDERSESQPIEERLPPSRDRDAVLGDASARPLKQLGLVRAKLLDLELEDEAPGEAEDERAVAVDEIFASNVDQTDATLLDLL
mmetsp:Transcript_37440/g.84843  ORF Transcript_37440/g.84843 Transcript_37440/m.84843 type:complete len:596 (+) Transcript_37440:900-2687(+)